MILKLTMALILAELKKNLCFDLNRSIKAVSKYEEL